MYVVLNGTDKSAFCTKYGCYETPRKVYGPNTFVSISGKERPDLITTKYDLTIEIPPIKSADLTFFTNLAENETVSVTYFSDFRGQNVTQTMIPSLSQAPHALQNGSDLYLYPIILTLREQ